jgi:hypothetical protein
MTVDLGQTTQRGGAIARFANAGQLPRWAPFLLVLVAAVVLRGHVVANVDVGWMLTVAEKMLAGQQLYVDVIELNPPAAVFLYVPPVVIGRILGVRPEMVVDALVLLAACLSMWLAGRVLARARLLDVDGWRLAALGAAILTILPAHAFGDRDPIALSAFLPALAVYAARSIRAPVPLTHATLAGLASAAAILIKPHLVLAVIASAFAAAVFARSWRPLLALEHWIVGAFAAAYVVAVAVAFPAFFHEIIPLITATYVARPAPAFDLLRAFALWFAALAIIWDVRRRAVFDPPFCVLLAASCGCALAFLAQGKGWPYHSFPMLALALLALAPSGSTPRAGTVDVPPRWRLLARTLAVGVLVGASFSWMNRASDASGLVEKIVRPKPHPSMLAITADIALGHPLVRQVDGLWVGRVCSNWISAGVLLRRKFQVLDPATSALLDRYEALDRAMLAEDIRRGRPDIILVEKVNFDWEAWARSDPALREQLKGYREAENFMGIAILRRAPSADAGHAVPDTDPSLATR